MQVAERLSLWKLQASSSGRSRAGCGELQKAGWQGLFRAIAHISASDILDKGGLPLGCCPGCESLSNAVVMSLTYTLSA